MKTAPDAPIEKIVRCPGCGGDSVYGLKNVFRPFCSARCKNGDLGAWASEGFRLPAEAPLDEIHAGDEESSPLLSPSKGF